MRPRALVALLLLAGCSAVRPVRFADAPPVDRAGDDRAIPLPEKREPVNELVLSDVYVRRPIVEALDPRRTPDALDVNALDEVPRSNWYWPGNAVGRDGPGSPPEPPFRVLSGLPESTGDGLSVVDAKGVRFELRRDPKDRPEMRSAAAVVTSRLLGQMGWFVAPSWALDVTEDMIVAPELEKAKKPFLEAGPPAKDGRYRISITRWPIGVDVGPTPPTDSRPDDPNDRIWHPDRRSLRAFKVVFGWLGVNHASRSLLRDTYLGDPGFGYLRHYIVDLGGAIGADDVVRAKSTLDDSDLADRNVWVTLGTLGLYRPPIQTTQEKFLALGQCDCSLDPAKVSLWPPFEPIDRTLPADAYWAAKRVLFLPDKALEQAVAEARISDAPTRAEVLRVLRTRRLGVLDWALSQVTPCELDRIVDLAGAPKLVLRDEAVRGGVARPGRYFAQILDADGHRAAPDVTAPGDGASVILPLPMGTPGDYRVVRVVVERDGHRAPRAAEIHLRRGAESWQLAGVRH